MLWSASAIQVITWDYTQNEEFVCRPWFHLCHTHTQHTHKNILNFYGYPHIYKLKAMSSYSVQFYFISTLQTSFLPPFYILLISSDSEIVRSSYPPSINSFILPYNIKKVIFFTYIAVKTKIFFQSSFAVFYL